MKSEVSVLLLCAVLFLGDQLFAMSREFSNEEFLDLDNELKLLNKPAITTIKTRYGEEYDCVDFYKQRAFDHPALKNHDFHPEMRPSSQFDQKFQKHSSRTQQLFGDMWANGKGCPVGSVPVKRVTRDDLIRIKLAEKIYSQTYKPTTAAQPGTHYAVMHTSSGTMTKFYGAGMVTGIYNPPVYDSQYSSSQLKLNNGIDTIQAGWMVNLLLFNDNLTRIFIYTDTSQARCFNAYCPGFVTTTKDFSLGARFERTSESGGQVYEEPFLIFKNDGKWWLQITHNITVGFWPETMFTGLKEFAVFAQWGGKVYSPPNLPSPPMGAGITDFSGTDYDGYCSQIRLIDESGKAVVPTDKDTSTYADITQYKVERNGTESDGLVILFGGAGGYIGN